MDDKESIKDQYFSRGFVVLRQFFDQQQVRQIHRNLERYCDHVVPNLPSMDVFYESIDDPTSLKMLPRLHQHDSYFKSLLFEDELPQLAEMLWSVSAVPKDAAYFNKLPKIGKPTPAHQDGYYFHLDPCEAMTMWLALDHVDEENGCVRYVPGSNRSPMRPHQRTEVLGFSQGIEGYSDQDRAQEVAVCAEPGDLIVHDAMTIHRADGNTSTTRSRRAIGFVYYSSRAQVDTAAAERYQQKLETDLKAAGKI